MSRHVLAPILLLLGAALSAAAVFGVHRIESSIGPFTEPYATRHFSPIAGDATIRFTTHRAERVTLRILDARGNVVRSLLVDERVQGARVESWDGRNDAGTRVRDGRYSARLTRSGDARTYAPARPIEVDSRQPVGRIVQLRRRKKLLFGVALLEPHARVEFESAAGSPLAEARTWRVQSMSIDGDLLVGRPLGTVLARFELQLRVLDGWEQLRVVAVDRAGNRRLVGIAGALFERSAAT